MIKKVNPVIKICLIVLSFQINTHAGCSARYVAFCGFCQYPPLQNLMRATKLQTPAVIVRLTLKS
jgi:hypothetical protein